MKRFCILLLMLLALSPAMAETPDFVPLLLQMAEGELGYAEGPNNYSKYGEWSGDPNAAWCAEFICWCVNQVDEQHGTDLLEVIYPNYSGQNTGRDWFITRGRFVYRKGYCPNWGYQWLKGTDHYLTKNEYIPQPGDLMFFSYNEAGDTEHVALVEKTTTDELGQVMIHVIEGNNPDRVQRNTYHLDDSQVLGFGLCADLVDTTMRFGNEGDKVTALQLLLCNLGYLDERHITGTYGAHTRKAITDFQLDEVTHKQNHGVADRETQQAMERVYNERQLDLPETWLVTE